jgi:nucleoid-associated protein YgaU
MANKFLVIVLTALFFSVTGAGLAEKIKEGEVVYYRIIKGDTLWDISKRFFEDPFRWQKLWKRNPYVKNPDLIPTSYIPAMS